MKNELKIIALGLPILVAAACGGELEPDEPSRARAERGADLESRLPPDHGLVKVLMESRSKLPIDRLLVEVDRVQVLSSGPSGGWVTIADTPDFVDLMRLKEEIAPIAAAPVPAGSFVGLRLFITQAYVVKKGKQTPVTIHPTYMSSGVKIASGFDLKDRQAHSISLDIDLDASLTQTLQGEFIFKPVVVAR